MGLHDDLFDLERRLLDPAVRRNAASVSSLLADEFREFGSSGRVYSKREIIVALAGETQHEITLHNFACKEIGPNAALVTYQSRREGTEALRSSLWVKRESRWEMVFHQGTTVPNPPRMDAVS